MDIKKRLGRNVTRYAAKRKITLERLAYENQISKGYIYDIANGKANVSIEILDKLARGLRVGAADLLA